MEPDEILKVIRRHFPFSRDEGRRVTKAYGLHPRIGLDAIDIAHPATIVIDRDRKVNYIHCGESQTDRALFNRVNRSRKGLIEMT